jgi:hypothetical protein
VITDYYYFDAYGIGGDDDGTGAGESPWFNDGEGDGWGPGIGRTDGDGGDNGFQWGCGRYYGDRNGGGEGPATWRPTPGYGDPIRAFMFLHHHAEVCA